jgi:uncharacterized protein YxeA
MKMIIVSIALLVTTVTHGQLTIKQIEKDLVNQYARVLQWLRESKTDAGIERYDSIQANGTLFQEKLLSYTGRIYLPLPILSADWIAWELL